jgi:hypothetical protein
MNSAGLVFVSDGCQSIGRRSTERRIVLPVLALMLISFFSAPSASAQETADADQSPCTHDEALEMGATLHQELDVSSPRWLAAKTEAEKNALSSAFIALMDASDQALRGNDGEACRQYRAIAAEQGIPLD